MSHICSYWVKIRRSRTCWTCRNTYHGGAIMNRLCSKSDTISVSYWCESCIAYINRQENWDNDGIAMGEFLGEPLYMKFRHSYKEKLSLISNSLKNRQLTERLRNTISTPRYKLSYSPASLNGYNNILIDKTLNKVIYTYELEDRFDNPIYRLNDAWNKDEDLYFLKVLTYCKINV